MGSAGPGVAPMGDATAIAAAKGDGGTTFVPNSPPAMSPPKATIATAAPSMPRRERRTDVSAKTAPSPSSRSVIASSPGLARVSAGR